METTMNANQIIANEHASNFDHLFFDFIEKATGLRNLSGLILRHACLAKAYDENGTIGTLKLNEFLEKVGNVRLVNITSVMEYVLWAFTPGEINRDKDGNPLLEAEKSCLRYNSKAGRFEPATDKVEVEEDGKVKIRKRARSIDAMDVKRRTSAYNWWDFNAAKPKSPYKAKFATALRSDLKAMAEGEYAPTKAEAEFLKAVEALAGEMGIELSKN